MPGISTLVLIQKSKGYEVCSLDPVSMEEILSLFLDQPMWDLIVLPLGSTSPYHERALADRKLLVDRFRETVHGGRASSV